MARCAPASVRLFSQTSEFCTGSVLSHRTVSRDSALPMHCTVIFLAVAVYECIVRAHARRYNHALLTQVFTCKSNENRR